MTSVTSESSFKMTDADFNVVSQPQVPCVVICDVSSSMTGDPIEELNDGLSLLCDELANDPIAATAVDLAIVTFGRSVELQQPFSKVGAFPPVLIAGGSTPMGAGVSLALDELARRQKYFEQHQIPQRRAWVYLISDGQPTDEIIDVAARARTLQLQNKLLLYSIGVAGADMATLGSFSTQKPLALKGLMFAELFRWVSQSMSGASRRQDFGAGDAPCTDGFAK